MLTRGDDYPIHQTPEPVAYTGANRNFYDRFFYNGYTRDGAVFFAAAMGVYPYLNVMDAAFSVVLDGVQYNVYGSKVMHMERLDTRVGPISVEISEPLRVHHLQCDDPANGIRADLRFSARTEVHEEPRFTRRIGTQVAMDYTRLTQNGVWSGWLEVGGGRFEVTEQTFRGTRDRSWGIRGVGEPDPQPNPVPGARQFYWLWAPINFDDCATHYFLNDDEHGVPWNTTGVVIPLLGQGQEETAVHSRCDIRYHSGTRHAKAATISLDRGEAGITTVELTPSWHFYMRGIGYGHPEWGHGRYHGELETGYDEYVLAEMQPIDLHIQAFCQAVMRGPEGERRGEGILEQLIIGPHKPSGFTDLLDMAP